MKQITEKIENRIKYLDELKCEINALYLVSKTKYEKGCLAERNMQISMELSFLKSLIQERPSSQNIQTI